MPIGILAVLDDNVKVKLITNTPTISFDDVSSNDFLESIRIVLKYILSQKWRKSKEITNPRS